MKRQGLLSLRARVVTVPQPRDYELGFEAKRRMLRSGSGLKKRTDVIGEGKRNAIVPLLLRLPR